MASAGSDHGETDSLVGIQKWIPGAGRGRLMALVLFLLVFGAPLVIALLLETCCSFGKSERTKMVLWNVLAWSSSDLAKLQRDLFPEAYRDIHWCYPEMQEKKLALSFDDAPGDNPKLLNQILDLLKQHNAQATFFCTTDLITPEMASTVERIVREGHELGNHMPADKPYSNLSKDEFLSELRRSDQILRGYDGLHAPEASKGGLHKLFRAPNLSMSSSMASGLSDEGYISVHANVFSQDSAICEVHPVPHYHVNFVRTMVSPGSVVLLHVPQRSRRHQCVDIVDSLLPLLSQSGYQCLSINGLVGELRKSSSSEGSSMPVAHQ